ncbi:kinase-like protein [Pseudovirgaria hyperparasitica]|uniref:Kinase-like protein n=1 Tax=Pseudovirgaria hyperparasitica TaxID=470096 RepID=A0A6A6W7A8_9PEZI|nr:kinase-like protein [Pseudovirgaria hyperparasitica]KAF2757457.1 kinase-like protein [Pseudovirgaria hyperparasitica]
MTQIKWPPGLNKDDLVGWGNFGFVCLDSSSGTVVKSPHDEEHDEAIRIEMAIYKRFEESGSHPGLLRYLGPCGSGLRLEFASNYGLRKHIQENGDEITGDQRLRWCLQIADTLAFVHSKGVVHGDLQWANIFLDGNMNAKVGDFAGSSLDGHPLMVRVTASHRSPGSLLLAQADIFALGSTLFEVTCGQSPYDGQTDKEIKDLFEKSLFPETKHLGPIGNIITGCWKGKYKTAYEVCQDIKAIQLPGKPPSSTF